MTHDQDEYEDSIVLDMAHGAVVPDSIAPKTLVFVSQPLAETTWVVGYRDSCAKKMDDESLDLAIQFA